MVVLAQLVRAPDCGSGGRRFEPGIPPSVVVPSIVAGYFSKRALRNQSSFLFSQIFNLKRSPVRLEWLLHAGFGSADRTQVG